MKCMKGMKVMKKIEGLHELHSFMFFMSHLLNARELTGAADAGCRERPGRTSARRSAMFEVDARRLDMFPNTPRPETPC